MAKGEIAQQVGTDAGFEGFPLLSELGQQAWDCVWPGAQNAFTPRSWTIKNARVMKLTRRIQALSYFIPPRAKTVTRFRAEADILSLPSPAGVENHNPDSD